MPAGVGLHPQPGVIDRRSSSNSSMVCGQQGLINTARSRPLLTHCITSCIIQVDTPRVCNCPDDQRLVGLFVVYAYA
jgi:hypothetical protein